jgi:D-alanine-D-alanine ligase
MVAMRRVAVFFGSRSVEHDVSIVTGNQTMQALKSAGFDIIPVYITRDGNWLTGDPLMDIKTFNADDIGTVQGVQETILAPSTRYPGLITPPISGRLAKSTFTRFDVAFSTIHGTHGEDGTIQGVFEMADIPYIGTGVLASAVANHKILAKELLRQYDIPVVDGIGVSRHEWLNDQAAAMERIAALGYPIFIKPATLGSSIGVARADNAEKARLHLDIALNLSPQVLVERAVTECVEINCAVMGGQELTVSALEQPVSTADFLSYDEKYMRGGSKSEAGMKGQERLIPAPISDEMTAKIQDLARRGFRAIQGRGIARIDFLAKPDEGVVYLNEINTMPGSLSFYLWKESDISAAAVVKRLIDIAFEVHAEKRQTTYDYQSGLIEHASRRGVGGVKK